MSEMVITLLGTAASMPTAKRGLTSTLISRDGEHFLFDCGEGTQRQMMKGPGLKAPTAIFLTHYHPDHWLGLPGLLATLKLMEHDEELTIYGPSDGIGTVEMVCQRTGGAPEFATFVGIYPEAMVSRHWEGYRVQAFKTRHTPNSLGYVFKEDDRPGRFDSDEAQRRGVVPGPDFGKLQGGQPVMGSGSLGAELVYPEDVMGPIRPGRKVVITGDTAPVAETVQAARDADVLVHEATFSEDMKDRARQTNHSTGRAAALVANGAGVGRLFLTHFSARSDPGLIAGEAAEVFNPTQAAKDGQTFKVPLVG